METLVSASEFTIICRTCLSKNQSLSPIDEKNVSELITQITKVEVNLTDGLPLGICSICLKILDYVQKFIEKCITSDKVLRSALVEKVKIENEPAPIESNEEETIWIVPSDYSLKEEEYYEESIELITQNEEVIDQESNNTCQFENDEPPTDCESCGAKFNQVGELRAHYKENKTCRENRFKCKECPKIFNMKHKLVAHMRSHTKEAPFECKVCFKTFRWVENLRRHLRVHEKGKRLYVCEVCDKGYSTKPARDEHLRTHTGETPYECKYCGKRFKSYIIHRNHVMQHQAENGELSKEKLSVWCEICNKFFSSQAALHNHNLVHTGEKKELCTVCGKKFARKGALDIHLRTHTGARPHKCTDCGKCFSQKASLNNHFLIHSGLKPFSCDLCDRSFGLRQHLRTHMKTHTGEKPHVCTFCGRAFALIWNLKAHERIHTGETPYECTICDAAFYDSSTLKKHKKRHEKQLDTTSLKN